MVGRDGELAQISSALGDRGCPALVIGGSAGAGKSRLAREACANAGESGVTVVWVHATENSATIPLGAVAEVIPEEVRSGDPLELLRRGTAALRGLGRGRRVLFAVDDAQLLDPASAALVLGLAGTPDFFVLATVRSGEPAPDAVDALWKDVGGRRLELSRVGDETIGRLLEAGLGGPVAQATSRRIVDSCAGNPLYARELVLGALEEGRLVRRHDLWQLEGWPALTPSLTGVIARRTHMLGADPRRALELVAIGEPLRLHEIAGLTSYESLEACEARGLITVGGMSADAQVGLAHPLYGEAVRAELPVLRGRALRLALAETIQRRRPFTSDDALRAVRWLLDAGAEIPRELVLDAAEAANLAGDAALAETLAIRAVAAGGPLRAALILARSHVIRGRFADAESALAAAEPDAPGDADALAYVDQRLYVVHLGLGDRSAARALLDRAVQWADDPGWGAAVDFLRLGLDGMEAGFGEQLASIRAMLERDDLDDEMRRSLRVAEGLALMAGDRLREATAVSREARPRPPLRNDREATELALACLVGAAGGEEWAELRGYLRETLREAIRASDRESAGLASFTLGELDFHAGRYRDAARWLAEAESHLEHRDTFDMITCIRGLQAAVGCLTAEPAVVQRAIESMRSRIARRPPRPTQLVYLACGEGWAARARSDVAGAEEFRRQASAAVDPVVRARLLHEALRAGGCPSAIADELTRLADEGDCLLTEGRAAHARALADRDPVALIAAAEQWATIGCDAVAVEALTDAARRFLAHGLHDSARRAASRARDLHPAGQGWALPAIEGLDSASVQLTRRETQIAALAARGLTNSEIAEQLTLSIRTVETHLYRAMQKRGVDDRRDL
jgi:DNA-binding CsgD family transcriptional regulator